MCSKFQAGFSVDNLETDFQDGTKLVALVQVIDLTNQIFELAIKKICESNFR